MKYSDGQPCLDKIDERFQVSDIDHAIAQIKQCFEEAGPTDIEQIHEHLKELEDFVRDRTMTGKEWYERFMSEINIPRDLGYAQTPDEAKKLLEGWIDEAARRAAGLGESDANN